MPRFSAHKRIMRRIQKLKEEVQFNTQKIREDMLSTLKEIFAIASQVAKGQIEVDDRKPTLKQRQIWAKVAAYTAQIINGICKSFDEKAIDTQLDELERLINEAKTGKETQET
ncbi:MAG: hypothetical protein QXM52_02445 [Candidatus Bathyarchaeia archaeon]